MTADSKRLEWVDMAKGLSIFLVVTMYCAASIGEYTGQTGFLHWSIAFATPFRMPEFFLISGLFLSQVIARPWRAFADRRVVHYLYFYALWAVIHILFKVALIGRDPVGAGSELAWALVQPYGVLWFIYMLAVCGGVAKLLHDIKAPHWIVLIAAAALQIAPISTGSYAIDQFAAYFVFFYIGYALAPQVFRLSEWAADHVTLALTGLAIWAIVNATLVFTGGFAMHPVNIQTGYASLPGIMLVLALAGSTAICVIAALLTKVSWMAWLQWLGTKSLIIYVAFVLPMGMARTVLIKLGVSEPNLLSLITMAVAIGSPLVLWWLVQRTGFGKFLFERPAWAHLPGTRRVREPLQGTTSAPAE